MVNDMSTNIIKINRGDSYELPIRIPEKTDYFKNHKLKADEAVYFALMYPHQKFEDAIILRGYDNTDQNENDEIIIKIEPNDTKTLTPGVYYYTVKFQKGGSLRDFGASEAPEEVRTLIERIKFIINE